MSIHKDEITCPICGKPNNCTHSKECWCHTTNVSKKAIDMVPENKRGRACICKDCVDKYRE